MYKIHFYKNRKGVQPVREYIKTLDGKNEKDSRIKANKIRDYIKSLSNFWPAVREQLYKTHRGN